MPMHLFTYFSSSLVSIMQIRFQLETLLEEKGRLAHDNSIYARENRFLREIVEYHQLTMQDVVYVDEGIEEVQEVYPIQLAPHLSHSSPGRLSPIISRAGSPNSSNHTSPRSPNIEDLPEFFPTAASSSPSSPALIQPKSREGTPPHSPKYEGLMRQRSLTPSWDQCLNHLLPLLWQVLGLFVHVKIAVLYSWFV